ncbi:hypothetical protein LTR85_005323 [Meristemomyces frigidus]|nr:hypothetical protein LTR85_005323 [Meristemomyces frigidus]
MPEATRSTSSGSRLLDLPAELRNLIYAFAVVQDEPIPIPTEAPYIQEPALLATNRQVRAECLPIYYGSNTFAADSPYNAGAFLFDMEEASTEQRAGLITRFRAGRADHRLTPTRVKGEAGFNGVGNAREGLYGQGCGWDSEPGGDSNAAAGPRGWG